jgi:predicted nucleotidyltransferase
MRIGVGSGGAALPARIPFDDEAVRQLCERYHVCELALFGSALRDDFGPSSDVDVLVEFEPDARVTLFDFVRLRDELAALFGREVDLVEKRGLQNPYRRREILRTAETLYAA